MTGETPHFLEMTVSTAGRPYILRYFDRPGPGPAILYIHGLGCSKDDFLEMAAAPELESFRLDVAGPPTRLLPPDSMVSGHCVRTR